jgi:hypothetical protein
MQSSCTLAKASRTQKGSVDEVRILVSAVRSLMLTTVSLTVTLSTSTVQQPSFSDLYLPKTAMQMLPSSLRNQSKLMIKNPPIE